MWQKRPLRNVCGLPQLHQLHLKDSAKGCRHLLALRPRYCRTRYAHRHCKCIQMRYRKHTSAHLHLVKDGRLMIQSELRDPDPAQDLGRQVLVDVGVKDGLQQVVDPALEAPLVHAPHLHRSPQFGSGRKVVSKRELTACRNSEVFSNCVASRCSDRASWKARQAAAGHSFWHAAM